MTTPLSEDCAPLSRLRGQAGAFSSAKERGQVLVIVALGLVVLVAAVGLVIDVGYAWGKQRDTQNAADASAESGAVAMAERLAGVNRTDTDVWTVVQRTATANGLPTITPTLDCADGNAPSGGIDGVCGYYTDIDGALILDGSGDSIAVGTLSGGAPPDGSAGVLAAARQSFDTFLARAIGFNRFATTAPATAVAGYVSEGIVLPVTFPVAQVSCDSNGDAILGSSGYSKNTATPYVVPLCKGNPGNVGWLDFTPPAGGVQELVAAIKDPDVSIPVPSWQFITATGNVNAKSVEDALRDYNGQVVLIPQFDSTCNTQPTGTATAGCPAGSVGGNGQNQWYHLPQFAAFQFCGANGSVANWCSAPYTHGSYLTGNDKAICNPANDRFGATSCLVGRFVDFITNTTVTGNVGANSGTGLLGVQLIR